MTMVLRIENADVPLDPARPITIGRAQDADVTVAASTVSRRHLTVRSDGQRWLGHDLGGVNGTFVNGVRLPREGEFLLTPGMDLVLGSGRDALRVIVADAPATPDAHAAHATQAPQAPPTPAPQTPLASARPAPPAPGPQAPPSPHGTPDARDSRSPASPDLLEGLTIQGDSLELLNTTPDAGHAPTRTFAPRVRVLTIGRASDNSVMVHDPLVSSHHARLHVLAPGRIRVEDLRSTNGTFVNGQRVAVADAAPGSVISVGRVFFRVSEQGLQRVAQAPVPQQRASQAGQPRPRPVSLSVSGVTFTVRDAAGGGARKALLDRVTFVVPRNSLLAIIGPSGAGKSTMLKTMTGTLKPDAGQVLFNGLDTFEFADSLSSRIGVVPQDDLVHTDLTARQALGYAARLRFPHDSPAADRRAAVDRVIFQLGLTSHANTRIRQMSGGQRKRVSTAMELLTRPELLFLDEPTSGLDPNLDREVMGLLADLAHGTKDDPEGRTVVVITHSTANLDRADNVLLLAPGGKVAYFGPPAGLKPYFAGPLRGDTEFASIYELIGRHPDSAQAAFARTPLAPPAFPIVPPQPHGVQGRPPRKAFVPQTLTLLARQARLLASDRSLLVFTLALPLVMGLVTVAVRAQDGFGPAADSKHIGEPKILLVIGIFGAVLMGMVPSVRQLVGERPIFKREAGVGVRPGAYLASKVLLLGAVCLLQSFLLVAVMLALNPHPERGSWGPLWLELTMVSFAVSWTAVALGLLLSALVSTSEQVMPLMVVVLMLQLVLCGGVINVNGAGVKEVSYLVPSRWGSRRARPRWISTRRSCVTASSC